MKPRAGAMLHVLRSHRLTLFEGLCEEAPWHSLIATSIVGRYKGTEAAEGDEGYSEDWEAEGWEWRDGEWHQKDSEGHEAAWHEQRDSSGNVYYVHSQTGESQWVPPLWIDQIDDESQAVYYLNTKTNETTWDMPADFVPIVRQQ